MQSPLLTAEEFEGALRQCLRHPQDYAEVRGLLAAGGFTVSEWLGVLCVQVRGRILTSGEAYGALTRDPALHEEVSRACLAVWR